MALEKRLLEGTEWMVEGKLTAKATMLLSKLDKKTTGDTLSNTFRDNVTRYIETFPKIKLPTGKPARSNFSEVCDAFDWFFRTYVDAYSWDIIHEATENYVAEYQKNNWMYMRTSKYFIRKQNSDKTWSSDLAEQCEMVKNGVDNDVDKFSDRVV